MDTSLFHEKQRFTQWWIWLILMIPFFTMTYGVYQQLYLGIPFGKQSISDFSLLSIFFGMLCIPASMLIFRLHTNITKEGIQVKFFPFHLKFREYKWEELKKVQVRKYSPLGEYGGWGLRGFGNNRALNVSGNIGLQLEFHNGKKLLIGTKKGDEITALLTQLNKLQP
ncbi:MAG TPA: hypothetical protein PLU73_01215 [Bacteroidia bacterium]|nr:hypothetical protein [Bacteroidia bacterium]